MSVLMQLFWEVICQTVAYRSVLVYSFGCAFSLSLQRRRGSYIIATAGWKCPNKAGRGVQILQSDTLHKHHHSHRATRYPVARTLRDMTDVFLEARVSANILDIFRFIFSLPVGESKNKVELCFSLKFIWRKARTPQVFLLCGLLFVSGNILLFSGIDPSII